MKKLNLGCGSDIREGYVNIDLYNDKADLQCDVTALPYEDSSIDEIFASHIIEHFDFQQSWAVLAEWYRVLKPGGMLKIETPDFFESCKLFVELGSPRHQALYGHFFSEAWKDGHVHKFLYTEIQLKWQLGMAGFREMTRMPPESSYALGPVALPQQVYLNLWAKK